MSAAFSSPPSRDGTGALLEQLAPAAASRRTTSRGRAARSSPLIANFRDENYLDINFPSYVAGYHSSDINTFVNRNVMSIDSYDWAHRTGANPPNEPSTVLVRTGRRSRSSTRGSSPTSISTCSNLGEPR